MQPNDMVTRLSAVGLANVAPAIAALALPSIRLTPHAVDEATLAVGASKIGGTPDLPTGIAWPVLGNTPLAFIAQIHLDELATIMPSSPLPQTGYLAFFYDAHQQTYGARPEDRGGWQVYYYDASAGPLQRRVAPAALPAGGRFRACAITYAVEMTLPQEPPQEHPGFTWPEGAQTKYESFLASFPSAEDHGRSHHRLLGHPDTLQDDMRLECQLASHGVPNNRDPRAAALVQGALEWQLLLQIDSDEQTGMEWGNTGLLYCWIERTALQARQFTNTWVVLQSE